MEKYAFWLAALSVCSNAIGCSLQRGAVLHRSWCPLHLSIEDVTVMCEVFFRVESVGGAWVSSGSSSSSKQRLFSSSRVRVTRTQTRLTSVPSSRLAEWTHGANSLRRRHFCSNSNIHEERLVFRGNLPRNSLYGLQKRKLQVFTGTQRG